MIKKLFLPFVLFFITSGAVAQVDLKKLDAYYNKALKEWGVPGMSVAIVKDGKVIFSKGYGVKEAGKREAPDENTLYAIASNTKAFTSAVIAQLVDEGKMSWDDKVQEHLPYFELYDPWVSQQVNIRDILSHRVGLGTFSGDVVWWRSKLSAEEIIRKAKHLPKGYDFRAGYGYSNVMFITAGEVIKKVSGKSWSQNVRDRFLTPLGMTRTTSTAKDLKNLGNFASPHAVIDGQHKPIPHEDWEYVAPTGGIFSSVKDMSQWLIFHLNHGIWNKDTLISLSSHNTVWTPHNNFMVDHKSKEKYHFRGYGLGWTLGDYYGKLRVGHTGGYTGMLSAVSMIPDENLGVVVLTNGMKPIFGSIVNYTLDAFLKAPERDWSAEVLAIYNQNKDTRIEERKNARVANTKPTVSLDQYTGEYFSKAYGKITVARSGEKLQIMFENTPDFNSSLEHWHYDTWELKWNNPEMNPWFQLGTVKFELDNNNKVTGIAFDVPNDDFWFDELNGKKIN